MERPKESIKDELAAIEEAEAEYLLSQVTAILKNKDVELESYSDYPSSVSNNAKRGLKLNEAVNNKCATQVGKVRAQQLAQGKPINLKRQLKECLAIYQELRLVL